MKGSTHIIWFKDSQLQYNYQAKDEKNYQYSIKNIDSRVQVKTKEGKTVQDAGAMGSSTSETEKALLYGRKPFGK